MQLDDLDFADDLALLSQSQQQMQEKTTSVAAVSAEVDPLAGHYWQQTTVGENKPDPSGGRIQGEELEVDRTHFEESTQLRHKTSPHMKSSRPNKKRQTKEHITPGNGDSHEKNEQELDGTRKEGSGQNGLENAGRRSMLHCPNETQLTMKSLQIEQSKRNQLLLTINQKKDHLYPTKFHYDQLLVQLIKENGHIQCTKSYKSRKKSPHSISSLDENEIDEVRKKLDHLQSLLIQVKNQLNSSPNDDDDDNKDSHKIDERIFANTLTELSLLQTTEKSTEENGQKINDSWQNLPNYVTFSVTKSHEYAVRNWLLSNFNHI
ncbi:unnamed protein product [Schistosoma curassoni]|uniref:Uncharacterized protein n=1 Tax=Schistosoma curassoni TaxID=6186 RepID=A0A183K489_9TREM|nr:unnamed protein product [Schistosoma curassoni]